MANVEAREIDADENEEEALQSNLERNFEIYETNWNKQAEPLIIKHKEMQDKDKAKQDEKIANYTKAIESRAGYCASEKNPLGYLDDVEYRITRT